MKRAVPPRRGPVSPVQVEHSPVLQHSAPGQAAGRRRGLDREACLRDRRWRGGGADEGRRWRRRAGTGATGRLLEGSNGVLGVGQVVERLPGPGPTCRPPRQGPPSAPGSTPGQMRVSVDLPAPG